MHDYFGGTTGQRIEDLIRENRISQAVLAKAVNVSKATMSRYIQDKCEIPSDTLRAIAGYLDVTPDFLLGVTDIPFKTNHDIDRLGLTAEAARRMLAGQLDMRVLNILIENDDFAVLTKQIAQYVDAAQRESLSVMNAVLETAGKLVTRHSETHPQDKENALRAYHDIRGSMVTPSLPDTAAMESTWSRILDELRKGAEDRIQKNVKLTTDIMEKIMAGLEERKTKTDLHSTTVRDITHAITDVVTAAGFPENEKEALEKSLRELFDRFVKTRGENPNIIPK